MVYGAFKVVEIEEVNQEKKQYRQKIEYQPITLLEDSKELRLAQGVYRLCIDNGMFCIVSSDTKKNYLAIPLSDVLGYEKLCEIENKGISIGKAVVGGFLFGGAGAILGGLMGTSKKNEEVILLISYKGEEIFLVLSPISLNALQKIMPEKQARPARQTNIQGSNSNQSSQIQSNSYDELEQLAQLRDKGIITDDEFNLKKKQILGL